MSLFLQLTNLKIKKKSECWEQLDSGTLLHILIKMEVWFLKWAYFLSILLAVSEHHCMFIIIIIIIIIYSYRNTSPTMSLTANNP